MVRGSVSASSATFTLSSILGRGQGGWKITQPCPHHRLSERIEFREGVMGSEYTAVLCLPM